MKNFIWNRDPQEAYKNPYEYEAQDQFAREASRVLNAIKLKLEKYNRKYTRDDTSLEKAIWMLNVDATDSLIECLNLLTSKKHKVAGRLIRDTVEVLDLSAFFHSRTPKSKKLLEKWYNDKVIPNSEFRDFVRQNISEEIAEELKHVYSQLSKINHRTYRSLAYGYVLGKDDKLVYDGFSKSDSLIYPGVFSMYYALLANVIKLLASEIVKRDLVSMQDVDIIWEKSSETDPIERKFITPEEVLKRHLDEKTTDNIR